MAVTANPDTQPAVDTVLLIREGMIHAEQMSRYYAHLAHRFRRLGELLGFAVVGFSLAGLFTILSPLPRWVPLLFLASTFIAGIVKAVGRYENRAVYSGDLYRQMQQLSSDWSDLYSDSDQRNGTELREAWRSLSRRQRTALLYSPDDLPLSDRLMRRCQREAVEYWSRRWDSSFASDPELGQQPRRY